MTEDILSQFLNESTIAWIAFSFIALFVFYIFLKKMGWI